MSLSDQNAAERKPDLLCRAASSNCPPMLWMLCSTAGSVGASGWPRSGASWPSREPGAAAAPAEAGCFNALRAAFCDFWVMFVLKNAIAVGKYMGLAERNWGTPGRREYGQFPSLSEV